MSKETLVKIDEVMGRIRTHPEYSASINHEFIKYLIHAAHRHSAGLEFVPGENGVGYINNITRAGEILKEEGISLVSLSQLGHIIQPVKDGEPTPKRFRLTRVNHGYSSEPVEIPERMDNFSYFLNNTDLHPVRRATEAHLGLKRIHPYLDGNSRSARLLQNFCLEQRGYTPAIIQEDEKELYLNLVRNALNDRYRGRSSLEDLSLNERLFNYFIESKVLFSAKDLEKELAQNRIYQVDLSRLSRKSIAYTVAKTLRAIGQRKGIGGIRVSLKQGKNHGKQTLKVRGNIGKRDLELYLGKSSQKQDGFKYHVAPLTRC